MTETLSPPCSQAPWPRPRAGLGDETLKGRRNSKVGGEGKSKVEPGSASLRRWDEKVRDESTLSSRSQGGNGEARLLPLPAGELSEFLTDRRTDLNPTGITWTNNTGLSVRNSSLKGEPGPKHDSKLKKTAIKYLNLNDIKVPN